jgi:hypothetical protein
MLFFQADIHQEHVESYLQKKETSNENDWMLWMTYVFFKKGSRHRLENKKEDFEFI